MLHTIDLPITIEQVNAYNRGTSVQEAFLHLTNDQREFYVTGITHDEWENEIWSDEEDEGAIFSYEDNVMYS